MRSGSRRRMRTDTLRILDLGCGAEKTTGAVGMDRRKVDGVDIVHDLEVLPWPVDDAAFDRIIASHIVEHLKPWLMLDIVDEMWRVLTVGGQVMIATPYAGSFGFHQDPTHIKAWNEATAHYFDPTYELYKVYTPKPWKVELNTWKMNGTLEVVLAKRPD